MARPSFALIEKVLGELTGEGEPSRRRLAAVSRRSGLRVRTLLRWIGRTGAEARREARIIETKFSQKETSDAPKAQARARRS